MFSATLFIIAKELKQPKSLFTDEWINEMGYIPPMDMAKKGMKY